MMNKPNNAFNNNILNYYCINNNTTRNSKNWVRHSISKCHIKYDKTNNNYILFNGHSDLCNNIVRQQYENVGGINKEIDTNLNVREILINKLN
jgi:hypothetical protein